MLWLKFIHFSKCYPKNVTATKITAIETAHDTLQRRHNERDDVSNHWRLDCSAVCSNADQRKHPSSVSLAFVKRIHRWLVDIPHKRPITRQMFPIDDVIMADYFKRLYQVIPETPEYEEWTSKTRKCEDWLHKQLQSSLCKFIYRHWTYEMSARYICRVCKIEHILLVIHYSIHGAVCFQFTQFPRDGWENILLCLIIIIKSEVWTMNYYPLLKVWSWNNGMLYVSLYSYNTTLGAITEKEIFKAIKKLQR